jgi:Cupin superfamily protein
MLASLLAPLALHTFLNDYYTRQFVAVIPGAPDKFKDLFGWSALNRCLEQHRFPPRDKPPHPLHLVKGGKSLLPALYLDDDRVNPKNLEKELAEGATLVLNHCNELHPPLQILSAALERLLHANVHINLYAGWRRDNGFEIHWDDQDTLILQIAGPKHWKVWPPTRAHPFRHDIVDTSSATKPDGPPLFDHVLEQGGLLSIPRGWWHIAYPTDEPCLHLTVTIVNSNGIDMLRWVANEMMSSEAARMDLPLFRPEEEKRAWLEIVRRGLIDALTDDLLERYVAYLDDRAKPPPSLRLPELTAPCLPLVDRKTCLQLAAPRGLRFQVTNGTATFFAAGIKWETTSDVARALVCFNDGLPHSAEELASSGHGVLTIMLTALVTKGVLRPAPRLIVRSHRVSCEDAC